ncbi:hypothetical protein Kfla_4894 [Kribbella flavida DSM 17836]|uniref:Mycothiol-dependent maleylpyruvate isomerase metal-binding domain-containing protein n=1 Tax=Kribbella flavida (strain DSM 17836 / JCM 10339 / NBRC 14399) TaxID=479435 RepID=D2Q0W0_KRIFD|nr:TIGR03086 family metal-binding protein [Kribbella flavida]ADB33910.1 hypothetical protein Kfla_4894 [Kribbella flavida DSM 17836]
MIDLGPAGRALVAVVQRIPQEALGGPTPCAEYDVRQLIAHVDDGARGFAGAAGGDGSGEPLDFAAAGWRETLAVRVERLSTAWARPAAWEGTSDLAGLGLSRAEWGKIALTELVVHGWDLAQATGQDLELPAETTQACYDHVAEFLRQPPVPELWGTPVRVPEDASLLDRLVGITGRSPAGAGMTTERSPTVGGAE